MLRDCIDALINTPRTGRRDFNELEKVEKTFIGTHVEIVVRRFLRLEKGLLDTLGELGVGCIAFSPLAQGMLTGKYLNGIPDDARASKGGSLSTSLLSEDNLRRARALADIAGSRGQTLAQMAIAWVLRDPRVTSALIGARTVAQLDDSLDAVRRLDFDADELRRIDDHAAEGDINLWDVSSAITQLPSAGGRPATA